MPRAPAPRTSAIGKPGAHECTRGTAPASVIAAKTASRASEASGGCTTRCRPKPDAVGICPASTAGSAGSSTCTSSSDAPGSRRRRSATWSSRPSASAWARSRRAPWSERTLSPRGFSTVADSVHGPATCTLNGPGPALGLLLDGVEVLGEQRPGPAVVDPRGVGEPPAGRLEVGAEPGGQGQPAAGHRGRRTATGQLGQVREVRQLAEHHAHRLGVVERVVGLRAQRLPAGHRPDAGGDRHA